MAEAVQIASAGLKLSGLIEKPENSSDEKKKPAFIILHGFGSSKNAGNVRAPAQFLRNLGFVTLTFDMRGCGESEGERGRLICLEQVEDTRNAITFLQSYPDVDANRIGLMGSSFGAAVALYTSAVDERVAATISSGGWGNGTRKFRNQHQGVNAWDKFLNMLEAGNKHILENGESLWVDRYDIVPIPEKLRKNVVSGSIQKFPVETAQSMYDFKAEDIVADIAPRPLLLLHSSVDSVTPTEQSLELFKRAGMPKDLHLFAETDHFMFAEDNHRVRHVVKDWLDIHFPVNSEPKSSQSDESSEA
ncbi:MAG: alpha/beta hydrolase [Methyloligellaceae bacterium]